MYVDHHHKFDDNQEDNSWKLMITIYDDHHTNMKTIINLTIIARITAGSYAAVEEELP